MKILPLTILNKHFSLIIKVLIFLLLFFFPLMIYKIIYSPIDYLQDDLVKIMYIHVPSAWLSMGLYIILSVSSIIFIIFKNPQFYIISRHLANVGIVYTIVALITGSIWGKPAWGIWWVWDARLTSMLFLLFIYLGYQSITCFNKISENNAFIASYYAVSGFIIVPVIKFSVDLWSTLHQPASIFRINGPTIHSSILKVLVIALIFHILLISFTTILSIKTELINKKL